MSHEMKDEICRHLRGTPRRKIYPAPSLFVFHVVAKVVRKICQISSLPLREEGNHS